MTRGLVLKTTGEVSDIEYDDYTDIQKVVGGYFDVVRLYMEEIGHLDIYVHDEGIYECPPNPYTTAIAQIISEREYWLFGDALITSGTDEEGEDISITEIGEWSVRTITEDIMKSGKVPVIERVLNKWRETRFGVVWNEEEAVDPDRPA